MANWREYLDIGLITLGSKDLLYFTADQIDTHPKLTKCKIGVRSSDAVEKDILACSMVLKNREETYVMTVSMNGAICRMKLEVNCVGSYNVKPDKIMMLIIYSSTKPYF